MKIKRGSITVYLCLALGALLSLFCAALFSVRHASGRAVLMSAAEQGMYSLFSRFDRNLFDEYGILALDGGYSTPVLKLGALQEEAEETVEFLIGDSGALLGPANLTHLSQNKGEVIGYTLLTDKEGDPLKRQIARAMLGKKAAAVVQNIRGQLDEHSREWKELEREGSSIDAGSIEKDYTDLQTAQPDGTETSLHRILPFRAAETHGKLCEETDESEVPGGTLVQTASENPIETIRGLQKKGILELVLPKDRTLSTGKIDGDRVSKRTLQQGMGIITEREDTVTDKVMLMEYLMDSFLDFTEAKDSVQEGLAYQIEYAIGKKESDEENLKAVLNRLLMMREISNYLFLFKDPVKQQEVQTEALSISALIGLPAAEPIVAEMLRLCWAFGESILDLRELLAGGKIPLIKDAASWQLSIQGLSHLQSSAAEQHGSENGLDYQWYLRLLLIAEQEKSLTESLMDLMEHRIRCMQNRAGFRLDNCIVSMTIRFKAQQDQMFLLETDRNYHYE